MKTKIIFGFFLFLLINGTTISLFGQEVKGKEETTEKFDANSFIIDHIADSHEWHILTKKNGESVAIYLPVIIYSRDAGLNIFSSKKLAEGKEYKGFKIEEDGDFKGKIVSVNKDGTVDEKNLPVDLSMTKSVIGMIFAAIIGLLIFLSLARSYKRTGISHPKGIQSFL